MSAHSISAPGGKKTARLLDEDSWRGRNSRVKQAFANDVLNSLDAQIAVLDAHGTIVKVNEEWKRFARENGSDDEAFYVGASYLAVCENAIVQAKDPTAAMTLDGMRELLQGKRNSFSVEYPCHSPHQQRWFIANITRFSHQGATYLAVVHADITARKLAENALRDAETTLRGVLEALPVGVWIMNRNGQIVHGNAASQRIWAGARYVGPEQFGEYKGWWLDSGRLIAAEEWAAARAISKGETSIDEEVRIQCFDGSSKIILNSAIPLRDDAGNLNGAVIVNQDITLRKRAEEDVRKANASADAMNRELQQVLAREQRNARTDDLTGLNNRRHFFELGKQLFAVAQRYGTPFSIVMFDLDYFKRINDLYGHQMGDTILKRVATIAQERVRHADVLARYGGEEFIVALPNVGAHEALAAAENIRRHVAAFREIAGDSELSATISAGVAEIVPGDDTLDYLIKRADQALYAAKNAGRNRCQIFSPGR
ncbi:MAG: hypothetical protein A3I66_14440 [Burkholderiales bacterium RIFCSPLOWO2_02_FULL_57_36]|nr:MAG: hypothetical protein A3I66_14440 [Burkholderiales bacterium RIFCSPLOWO2_02_FULL_57_36]